MWSTGVRAGFATPPRRPLFTNPFHGVFGMPVKRLGAYKGPDIGTHIPPEYEEKIERRIELLAVYYAWRCPVTGKIIGEQPKPPYGVKKRRDRKNPKKHGRPKLPEDTATGKCSVCKKPVKRRDLARKNCTHPCPQDFSGPVCKTCFGEHS